MRLNEETILKEHLNDEMTTTELKVDSSIVDKYSSYYYEIDEPEKDSLIQTEKFNIVDTKKSNESKFIDFNLSSFKTSNRSLSETYAQNFTKLIGFVTKIEDDFFEAKLFDNDLKGTYEIGEFDISDIDYNDMNLLSLGAVFYWTFGHFKIHGQVKKQSELRFQRLAILDTEDVNTIIDEANNLNDSLNWD